MFASGCVLTARPATVSVEASYGGWTSYYYNGSLVYFDTIGRPYYYYGGRIMYVPSTWASYNVALANWRTNRVAYNRWHARYNAPRYRTVVRRPLVAPRPRTRPAPVRSRYKR
ncbi:MAG: hypothetical protein CVU65_06560 [Deltaproteobacteria bacterium HGW-Deltaproteobacteria-22]|nr:MAG: hypothetical protein CVU65_06560 [Deltaproteobacteria bacterium HGW-Deltaproteobacteria-22]